VALTIHPSSRAEVEGRVELYIVFPPGTSWPVLGWTLSLPLLKKTTRPPPIKISDTWRFHRSFSLRRYRNLARPLQETSTFSWISGSAIHNIWQKRQFSASISIYHNNLLSNIQCNRAIF